MRRRLGSLLAAGLLLATPASAAEMYVTSYKNKTIITIEGKILVGDEQKFATFAASIPKTANAEVVLSSRGGSILGLEIGRIIHRRGFRTVAQRYCNSICSLIWLASPDRALYSGTSVGFHAVGDKCNDDSGCQEISAFGNALVGVYLTELGFGEPFIRFVTSAPPSGVTWLTPDNAGQYSIKYELLAPLFAVTPAKITPDLAK